MLYQAYQAHCDMMGPLRAMASGAISAIGMPLVGLSNTPVLRNLTAVYELMDAEHAGVSAHIARAVGYPLDLVMSYGGGPNVRQKLLRRGWDSLSSKRLVIWMMTARDLYDYWEDWESLQK